MSQQVDQHSGDRVFKDRDFVILKLQTCKQLIFGLLSTTYDPYKVLDIVGAAAGQIELPPNLVISQMFNVLHLKVCTDTVFITAHPLPQYSLLVLQGGDFVVVMHRKMIHGGYVQAAKICERENYVAKRVLARIRQLVKGCSYYTTCSMKNDAQLVLVHTITSVTSSVNIEEDILDKSQMELQQLCFSNTTIYQPLYELAHDLTGWMEHMKFELEKWNCLHHVSSWKTIKIVLLNKVELNFNSLVPN